ncbi:hypothetical protein DPMN_071097 [Dreissena polymorpha]|uniref:Uncharacterized protein n=1 Tax=Dreissena polymorpha TaxID=45954 RepID=A0A9D3Z1N3_DREPO|nr:hypothetical protein DPMN_071097 [Dreissena polymorpha]
MIGRSLSEGKRSPRRALENRELIDLSYLSLSIISLYLSLFSLFSISISPLSLSLSLSLKSGRRKTRRWDVCQLKHAHFRIEKDDSNVRLVELPLGTRGTKSDIRSGSSYTRYEDDYGNFTESNSFWYTCEDVCEVQPL